MSTRDYQSTIMPHLNLEYSANIDQAVDFSGLFRELHQVLNEAGGVSLNNCKSRARTLETFYIGDGSETHALVHLEIALLAGRSMEIKNAITGGALEVLQKHYQASLEVCDLQISVELRDIDRDPYAKIPAGTLTPILRGG
jgi:5-carboxymethyl-2-hydroxymuconate isomerase